MFLLAFHNPLPHRAPLHFPLFLLWGIKVRELVLVDNHRHQDRKEDSKDTPTVSWGVIFDPRPTSGTDNSQQATNKRQFQIGKVCSSVCFCVSPCVFQSSQDLTTDNLALHII